MVSKDDVLCPGKRVAYRVISGQAVLVESAEDVIITLNETGTAIWENLDHRSAQEIADIIASKFEVSAASALKDTIDFLSMLKERGIVEVAARPESE